MKNTILSIVIEGEHYYENNEKVHFYIFDLKYFQ